MSKIVRRWENNPVLTAEDVPYEVSTVHNAGVVRHRGRYVMLFRSHLPTGRSVLGIAESDDGFGFRVAPEPFMTPAKEGPFAEYEEYGVEDPRVTPLEGRYYITYSAYSRHGVRIGLARTDDFRTIERVAFITRADERNVVLFPEKINGRYARLDRPHTHITPWSIWISYSPDLVHWGGSTAVMGPRPYHWDEAKIGPGAPPVRTEKGWLSIYHGVFSTMGGNVYRLGAALHDLGDPARLLGVAGRWILEPRESYERVGYVPNVVFCCGAVAAGDGTLRIYYGAADTVMCAAIADIGELVELCL
jgi:predicted GH43/DUF377 family glycosyl hydrolase